LTDARRSEASAPLAISVLAPADDADAAMTASVRRALEEAGVVAGGAAADALVLVGGVSSRAFFDADAGTPGPVRSDIVDAVRTMHASGGWVAATGAGAVAAALLALEAEVIAGRATRQLSREGVTTFSDLRLICLDRPMLCEIDGERDAAIGRLVAHLVSEAAPV
jgi:putative intracellular protease/amidase